MRGGGEILNQAIEGRWDATETAGPGDVPDPGLEVAALRRSRAWTATSYILTVFLLITVNFVLPRAMPGDPISVLMNLSAATDVQQATADALADYYGLDRPLLAQYASYLAHMARGDLGLSIRYNRPVAELVAQRLPWTLLLIVSAMTLAAAVGLLAGAQSAWRRGRPVDRGLLTFFLTVRNFPVFFLGSLALFVFAVKLRWLPLAGARTPFSGSYGLLPQLADVASHLVLPASVLAVQFAAGHFLIMRASMVSELGADYLLLGRAKGLRERRLKYGYAARNALLPVVTLITLQLGFAVSGTILVETVFAYPGMGRLLYEAVAFRDYPTLQACFLVLGLVVVTLNLLADVLYRRLDPRTRT
ncbi:MAG: ABC transporter permease [Actinomycetota bacterium]|nr:ABC transporter permease [Actinomycetota bacterium]